MMDHGKQIEPGAGCTLGDQRTVELLLSIVTGTGMGTAHGVIPVAEPVGEPGVERMPRWDGHTLEIERTPAGIRELRDEGIISAATPWKRPPP